MITTVDILLEGGDITYVDQSRQPVSTTDDGSDGNDSTAESGGRSKRRKRRFGRQFANTLQQGPLAPVARLFRQFFRYARRLMHSPYVLSVPLMLLLMSSVTDYLVLTNAFDARESLFYSELPEPFEDERRGPAEALKSNVQAAIYLFTLLLCAFHYRRIFAYFGARPHLALILLTVFATALWSVEPTKVVTNSIQILIGMLLAMLFAMGQGDHPARFQSFYLAILLPLLLVHFASFLLMFAYGTNVLEFLASTERYGGFAGNPNNLGGTAVIGVWAAGCLALTRSTPAGRKLLAWFAFAVFCFSIAVSGSGTAVATVLVLGVLMVWMRLLAATTPQVRFGLNIFAVLVGVIGVLAVLILVTPAEIFLLITDGLGKDATLTGRTELWAIAREAISMKPWFGWGFDAHESVKSIPSFFVRFNHYHNGFLDTLVAGGFWLLLLVLYNLAWFVYEFLRGFRLNPQVFPLIMPLIILVILNLSEYSLLRPLSQQWQVYISVFVLLTWHQVDFSKARKSLLKQRQKSKGKVIRWA